MKNKIIKNNYQDDARMVTDEDLTILDNNKSDSKKKNKGLLAGIERTVIRANNLSLNARIKMLEAKSGVCSMTQSAIKHFENGFKRIQQEQQEGPALSMS